MPSTPTHRAPRPTPTLGSLVQRRLLAVAGFAAGFVAVATLAPALDAALDPAPPVPVQERAGDLSSRAERLVERHGCGSGAAPADMAGEMPGHVVLTTPDGTVRRSARWVEPALYQVLGGPDHDLVVHAFCR